MPRPCAFATCKYNLLLDRESSTVDDASCALDVADRGGATLEDIAEIFGVTRERIRQIEDRALSRIQRRETALADFAPGPLSTRGKQREEGARTVARAEVDETMREPEPSAPAEMGRHRASFFTPDESANDAVCASVWSMLARRERSDAASDGDGARSPAHDNGSEGTENPEPCDRVARREAGRGFEVP